MSLEEKVCLVTGAGRGIGKAIARKLATEGAIVFVNDRDSVTVEECVIELRERGWRAEAFAADVSSSAEVSRMFDRVGEQHGKLDVLVNNAAISRPHTVTETTDEVWQQVIAVNLSGVFYCCREAFRLMERTGGSIVNLSSVSAFTGKVLSENVSYIAAKGGVNSLTRALAAEGVSHNIRVNNVAPGIVETEIHQHMSPARKSLLPTLVPMQRLCSPEEVADAVYYLASPASAYITGHTLHINGGMFAE